jgi:hypothetical protein
LSSRRYVYVVLLSITDFYSAAGRPSYNGLCKYVFHVQDGFVIGDSNCSRLGEKYPVQ